MHVIGRPASGSVLFAFTVSLLSGGLAAAAEPAVGEAPASDPAAPPPASPAPAARRRRRVEGGVPHALRGGAGRPPRAPPARFARRAPHLLARVVPGGHPRRLRRLAGSGRAQPALGRGDRPRPRRRRPRREGVHRRQAGDREADRLRAGGRSRPAQVPLRIAALAGDGTRGAGQRRREATADRRRVRAAAAGRDSVGAPGAPSRSACSDPTTSSAASRWPGSAPSPTSAAPASTTRISSGPAACPSARTTTCRRCATKLIVADIGLAVGIVALAVGLYLHGKRAF